MNRHAPYSRAVFIAKIVLPVLAAGLFLAVFFLSGRPDLENLSPSLLRDMGRRVQEQRLTSPRLVGATEQGMAFSITADRARPDPGAPHRISAQAPSMDLEWAHKGRTVHIHAATAVIERASARFVGDVVVRDSLGLVMRTDVLRVTTNQLGLVAPGQVRATTPLGSVVAGQMRLSTDVGTGQSVLRFAQGVDMVYRPSPSP